MKRFAVLVAALVVLTAAPAQSLTPAKGRRVVVFAIPGVDWDTVRSAQAPVLQGLIERGAIGGLVVRTSQRGMTPTRGYLTTGAGQRAFAERTEHRGDVAYRAGDRVENGTALDAAARRYGRSSGEIVHLELEALDRAARGPDFGARFGALGQALRDASLTRAVISAADVSLKPSRQTMRRSVVTAIADERGGVDHGTLDGLLVADPAAPFGVRTDAAGFRAAYETAARDAQVVVIDPGETQRADEFAAQLPAKTAAFHRKRGLERADALLGIVTERLTDRDLLLVVAPSGPRESVTDVLTPVVAVGAGFESGWLTSRLTRRDGLVMLTEIGPTVVRQAGAAIPDGMGDAVIERVPSADQDRVERIATLSRRSVFRERYSVIVTAVFIALLALVAFGAFVTFLVGRHPGVRVLTAGSFAVLAMPPAATLVRALGVDSMPMAATIAALLALTALISLVGWTFRRRWAGAVALLLIGFALIAVDMLRGAPWQLNGAFGYSPLLAGRFYGNGNLGYATLFTAGIVGLTGLAALRGCKRAPLWLIAVLTAIVAIEGAPQWGADFGGVLAGVPAVIVTVLMARGKRVRLRALIGFFALGGLLGAGVMVADYARGPDKRTHLGGFASRVIDDPASGLLIVQRKLEANLQLFTASVWVYAIPIGVAVLVLLLARRKGVHAAPLREQPLLRAGLYGAIVAGVIGFLVNDSGVIIPGMMLAHLVPFVVVLGLDQVSPRATRQPVRPPMPR